MHGGLPILRTDEPVIGIQGPDPRAIEGFFNSSRIVRTRYALTLYSGNLLVPTDTFKELGGFDEYMVGHGGEDCEFAVRCELAELPVIFSEDVVGYHVYHWRDQARNEFEVLDNIDYIREKHDLSVLDIVPGRRGQLPLVYKEE